MNQSPSFEEIMEIQNKSIQFQTEHWLKNEVFTFQFWLLLALMVIPWFVWWKLVDKKRILEIIIYGLVVITFVTFLDEVGCQLNLWEYRYDIEPLFPRLIPMNFTLLPVGYMLIYQYFTKWKSFVQANIIFAVFFAFIGEPFFVLLDIYELVKWKHIYSFPIYILLAFIFKIIINGIMKINHRTSG